MEREGGPSIASSSSRSLRPLALGFSGWQVWPLHFNPITSFQGTPSVIQRASQGTCKRYLCTQTSPSFLFGLHLQISFSGCLTWTYRYVVCFCSRASKTKHVNISISTNQVTESTHRDADTPKFLTCVPDCGRSGGSAAPSCGCHVYPSTFRACPQFSCQAGGSTVCFSQRSGSIVEGSTWDFFWSVVNFVFDFFSRLELSSSAILRVPTDNLLKAKLRQLTSATQLLLHRLSPIRQTVSS